MLWKAFPAPEGGEVTAYTIFERGGPFFFTNLLQGLFGALRQEALCPMPQTQLPAFSRSLSASKAKAATFPGNDVVKCL